MSSSQLPVEPGPADAISSLKFSPRADSNRFLVSSWDKNVYLYELDPAAREQKAKLLGTFEHRAPVLDACFGENDDVIYSAGLDWDVRRIDVGDSSQKVLSTHDAGVRCVAYSNEHNMVISGAWDSTLHLHRAGEAAWEPATVQLPAKAFAFSLTSSKLVVAMANRTFYIYELEKLASACSQNTVPLEKLDIQPWQHRESSLKFMTRAITCMPTGDGYASSSIEGRVAVEWFDPSEESQSRKYAFKCHRQTVDGVDIVYPVNSLAFHPQHGTFITGGGDGIIALWDAVARRRIRQYPKYPASIAAAAFNNTGRFLVVAVSSGFEDGKDELEDGIVGVFVREFGENEAKRKTGK